MLHQGFQSIVFHGDSCLGEADIFPLKNSNFQFHFLNNEIRITHFSLPSERCLPLSVLQTISPFSLRFKLQSKSPAEDSLLNRLHASCFRELKTAIVVFGDEELHLIAMPSKLEKKSCFWGFSAASGLYNSCLGMLNLRCLGIVFDLDETLIVANTMRSFEDRIDAIQRKIGSEVDPVRISGMTTELKRYLEDKMLLKQYSESDTVTDNGRSIKVQSEEVPPLSDGQERVVRPIIRLQDKNIVLTRINPEVRDTSVLVRLRPAWEDLRSYLTARGRKRFEVYVCTMAERDYALEMWRLLDPEAHLISSKQLLARVVCVKSGSRKSLLNVFQDGIFHPKMAMVIDDRLKVWDDKDQSRVHVVPAFAPYYAPQAEIANAVPVLCVARNVACNVRGGFFKEFDDNLLRRVSEVYYEDDVIDLPSAPDVSNYLMSEDSGGASNGNRDLPVTEGMSDAEVERRVKHTDEKFSVEATSLPAIINNPPTVTNNLDMRPEPPLQHVAFPANILLRPTSGTSIPVQRSSLLGTPGIEADVSQAELDPDTRRRLLILQHGQDTRDHSSNDLSYQSRPPALIPVLPAIQPLRGCFSKDEDMILGQYNRRTPGLRQESDPLQPNKHRSQQTPFFRGVESSIPSEKYRNFPQVKEEVYIGDDWLRQNHVHSNRSSFSDDETATDQASTNNTLSRTEAGILAGQPSMYVGVLQEIGMKCGYKVEYKSVVNTSKDLPFSVEALFTGEKIGAGMGKTKKEAQQVAAGNALLNLANKYWACISPDPGAVDGDLDKLSLGENGFLMDIVDLDSEELQRTEVSPRASTSELLGLSDDSKRLSRTVSALKELCMTENLSLVFQDQLPISNKGEFHAQVEVAGQIIGKGIGSSRERAKLQAAEEALGSFKLVFNQQAPKRSNSPRSPPTIPTKRSKEELLRGLPGLPSSSRYNKNGHPVS